MEKSLFNLAMDGMFEINPVNLSEILSIFRGACLDNIFLYLSKLGITHRNLWKTSLVCGQ